MNRHRGRASILLEVVVSIAMFVAVGMTILGVMGQGEAALRETRDRERAMDLARSAVAAIEAGLATPQSVAMLVRAPAGGPAWLMLDPDAGEDAGGVTGIDEGSMELEVDVEPTADVGLSLLTVRVGLARTGGAAGPGALVLRQIVRMVPWSTGGSSGRAGEGSRGGEP